VTKPKFTPDPPPVGGSSEEHIAWAQRQYARIHDWWPKDLEDRLAALELRWPYKSGTWPIVDASSINFNASAAQLFALNCGEATEFTLGETCNAKSNNASISIFGTTKIFLSKRGIGINACGNSSSVLYEYDIINDTWTTRLTNSGTNKLLHFPGSLAGQHGVNDVVYAMFGTSGATWNLYQFDPSDWASGATWGTGISVGLGTFTMFCEGLDRLIGRKTSGVVSTFSKNNGSQNNMVVPTGYDSTNFIGMWLKEQNKWIVMLDKDHAHGGVIVNENYIGTLPTPTKLLDFDGSTVQTLTYGIDNCFDKYGNLYFSITSTDLQTLVGSTYNSFVVKLDNEGNHVRTWSVDDIGIPAQSFQQSSGAGSAGGLYYNETSNRVYTAKGGYIAQYDPDTDQWSTCIISNSSGDEIFLVADSSDYLWSAKIGVDPVLVRQKIY